MSNNDDFVNGMVREMTKAEKAEYERLKLLEIKEFGSVTTYYSTDWQTLLNLKENHISYSSEKCKGDVPLADLKILMDLHKRMASEVTHHYNRFLAAAKLRDDTAEIVNAIVFGNHKVTP